MCVGVNLLINGFFCFYFNYTNTKGPFNISEEFLHTIQDLIKPSSEKSQS